MKDIKISQKSRKFVMLLACTLGVALILAGLLPDRSIVVAASQTEDFYIVDGELLSYSGKATKVTLPKEVKKIGTGAFTGNQKITQVIIPDTVKEVGEKAFADCSALKTVRIGKGIGKIPFKAFYQCDTLSSVTLSEGITSIGESAFEYCYSLKNITIPASVKTIGIRSFSGDYELKTVTFAKGSKWLRRLFGPASQDSSPVSMCAWDPIPQGG